MRIGLVSQEYPPETAKGGIGTQTFLKARGLTRMGHDVRVISRSPETERTEVKREGVRLIRIPSTQMPVYTELADWLTYSQHVAQEIASQHAREPFDILDFPEWACEGYVHLLNQSQWNRIPTVVQLHGPLIMLGHELGWPDMRSEFFRTGTQMEATTLRLADAIYSSSACSADWCAREYGLDRKHIPVIHSGIDTKCFHPRLEGIEGGPIVVFVGKLVRNKGAEILVDAVCSIAGEFPGLQLHLLGGGEEAVVNSIRQKMAGKGLLDILHLSGYMSRQDLAERLSKAQIFAAPSIYEGGPGFVYLEAMACALPVIGCAGSGASEVIADGDNGLLVRPGDVSALAHALRQLLTNDTERRAMGNRARKFVLKNADSENCVERIAAFYESVIGHLGAEPGDADR